MATTKHGKNTKYRKVKRTFTYLTEEKLFFSVIPK